MRIQKGVSMSPKVWEILFKKYGSRGYSRFIEHAVIKALELGGEISKTEAKNLEAYEKIGCISQEVRENLFAAGASNVLKKGIEKWNESYREGLVTKEQRDRGKAELRSKLKESVQTQFTKEDSEKTKRREALLRRHGR
jgi:hypothetical protein